MSGRHAAFLAFSDWMGRLREQRVPVVQLRAKPVEERSAFEGDFDLICDPAAFASVVELALRACIAHGTSAVVDQSSPYKRRINFGDGHPDDTIVAELWPHAELRTVDGRNRVAAVRWSDLRPYVTSSGQLPEAILGLLYIGHLHHKRKDLRAAEVLSRLEALQATLAARDDPMSSRTSAILDPLLREEPDLPAAHRAAVTALTECGVRIRPLTRATPTRVRRAVARRTRRTARPAMVPVVGPDGVGKTALVASVERGAVAEGRRVGHLVFKSIFRDAIPVRLLLRAARLRDRHTHDRTKRNLMEERHPHVVMISALTRWPLVRRRWARSDGHAADLVLVDRYFWDYLLVLRDPSVAARPITAHRAYAAVVPRPEQAIVLGCSTAVIHQRKQELSAEAIDALYRSYCRHIVSRRVPRTLLLSTEIDLGTTGARTVRFLRDGV
jgi:hypothetical protein